RVVVMARRRGRRQEDGQRAGRVLHEEVPIRNVPVQEHLRVAAVEADVAEVVRVAKETTVRNRTGSNEERRADETRPECVSRAGSAARQGGGGCAGGGAGAVGGGAGVVGGGAGAGVGGFGATWKPSRPLRRGGVEEP